MSKSGKNANPQKDRKPEAETTEVENTGNYLRTLRLGKGLSIQDIAEATRISETNLNAIEDMDFASLPANTFTRGLLNIYANFLGADAGAVVTKFMEEREGSATQKRRSRQNYSRKILTPKRLAEPAQISSMTMAGVLLLFIVVSFTGYCVYTSWNPFSMLVKKEGNIQSVMKSVFPGEQHTSTLPADEEIIIVPANEVSRQESLTVPQPFQKTESTPAMLSSETAEPAEQSTGPQADALEAKYTVSVSFFQDTTLELTRDDDETLTEEFRAGELHTWSAGSSMSITFAKPDSAEILVNNVSVPFPVAQDGRYTLHIPQDVADLQHNE